MIAGLRAYDRFHTNYDRIYRVLSKPNNRSNYNASAPMPVRAALREGYDGIEKVVTFKKGFGGDASHENVTVPVVGYFCSEELFDIFSFSLKNGNPATALLEPFSVVLTQQSALKLFGDIDPLGKVIRFSERGLVIAGTPNKNKPVDLGAYTVTGIMKEPPGKTHLEFHILASLSTLPALEKQGLDLTYSDDWKSDRQAYTYVMLSEGKDAKYLQSVLDNITVHEYARFEDFSMNFKGQPLSKITPGKMYGNPFSYRLPMQVLYFLSILAAIVIISACFNYTNLSLAKSLSRAREVGIRKVSGAFRVQILGQFIGESILVAVLSLVLAIGLLQFLQPAFRGLWLTQYILVDMAGDLQVYLIFLLFSIAIGIIAGVIPAFYLSSFKPIKVLKDASGIKAFKSINFRKALIVGQFTTSLFFVITTTVIYYQLDHLMHTEYGFNEDNILNVPLQGNSYQTYANAIRDHSGVVKVSGSSMVPGTGGSGRTVLKSLDNPNDSLPLTQISANGPFFENLELKIVAGKSFSEMNSQESEQYLILNQKAVEKLGYLNLHEALGNSYMVDDLKKPLLIVGVVENFHFRNFMKDISPLAIRCNPDDFRFANIRLNPSNQEATINFLENKWKELDNGHAFEAEFMDHQLADSHSFFSDIGYIVGTISLLAVSIACLGLLGMVIFVTQTKVKEVGIRKVHGATTRDVILLLSKGFITMLFIAIVIATPLAKMVNELWLREFAVRVKFGMEILAVSILIMLLLGAVTIFSQTIKSARRNPVDALKYE
jgi:putative ABC transport system permease protein